MLKFMVAGGFLGSGKTSLMISLYRTLSHKGHNTSIISNDLSAAGLVDSRYSQQMTGHASEITGGCICYKTEELVDRLRSLSADSEFVMSDIPGFGIGALQHVYVPLHTVYAGEFELAPFLAVVDPNRLALLKDGSDTPEELAYLLRSQIREAEVLVLNKIDLLSPTAQEECIAFLQKLAPSVPVFPVSCLTGSGLDALADHLLSASSKITLTDLQYGGILFQSIMSQVAQYTRQFVAEVCCNTFDGNAFLSDLAREMIRCLKETGCRIPHLKLYGIGNDAEFAKLSLVDASDAISFDHKLETEVVQLPVVINTSLFGSARAAEAAFEKAIQIQSEAYHLTLFPYLTECIPAEEN